MQPAHPWSLMQIAFEYLKRGDAATALPWAQQAVAAAPNAFPAHKALGQALLDTGDVDGAIKELLIGLKLAPDSPGLHFTLARAYQRAGRNEDAAREREEFTRSRPRRPDGAQRFAVRRGAVTEVLQGSAGFYWVLQGSAGFYKVLRGSARFSVRKRVT